MPMTDEPSSLWLQTLGANHHEDNDRLRASYVATRENATVLLNELSHSTPNFTVHDITHVDALWGTASMLCGSSVTLTPAEGYVLGCAFILHDAAMGAASYQESIPEALGMSRWHDLLSSSIVAKTGNWPTADELADPDEEIVKACTEHAIRELHAVHAEKLVDQSWTTSSGNEKHLIEDLQLREWYGPLIGRLAASHWWPVARLTKEFRREQNSPPWLPGEWIIDPLKLACLLRLADATQIDSRRAPTFLFALRRPEGVSREHWRFQEHVGQPRLTGDRVTYTAARPFEERDADAWWLALDYLRGVDAELKNVDALLFDLKRPQFAGRAVAGVDSPERFAEHFEVRGWSPVDARIAVSDVPHLVETLGGEQLYGRKPEVALRELVQNAQDATLARKSLDPDFTDDEVVVTLTERDGTWTLEVTDRGVGMDEDILTTALLDFGRTGWTSDTVRKKFTGLVDGGFRPKGRFGIGFFSVFILGDDVEIVSRRFDSAAGEARRLTFHGVRARPILTPIPAEKRTPVGTRVRVTLKDSPYDILGLFSNTRDDRLDELVQWLCPEHAVPIRANEPNRDVSVVLPPVDLSSASASEVFDILYPPVNSGGVVGELQRQNARERFTRRATEMVSEDGIRIGMAAYGSYWYYAGSMRIQGAVLVNGFRSDELSGFAGYMIGRPSRASRDRAEIAANDTEVRDWLNSQEKLMRDLGVFGIATQIDLTYLLYLANRALPPDYVVAITSTGLLRLGDVTAWAAGNDEITLVQGWPLSFHSRRLKVVDMQTEQEVELPDKWLFPMGSFYPLPVYAFSLPRDEKYEFARQSQENTWQKVWWRTSGSIEGLVLKLICEAWDCEIGEILEPVEKRGWCDFAEINEEIGPVSVYRLNRPVRRT
jgi:hypothetical protein